MGENLRIIEGEIQALRQNVERDLVSGLRDQIARIVREALMLEFADIGNDGVKSSDLQKSSDGLKSRGNEVTDILKSSDGVKVRNHEVSVQHFLPLELPHTQVWKEAPVPSLKASENALADDMRLPGTPHDLAPRDSEAIVRQSKLEPNGYIPRTVGTLAGLKPAVVEEDLRLSYRKSRANTVTQTFDIEEKEGGTASHAASNWIKKTQRLSRRSSEGQLNALQKFAQHRQESKSGIALRLVSSDIFDYFMCFILMLNGAVMGIQVDWAASNPRQDDPLVFLWADRIFCIAFVSELALRLYVYELAFYLMPGWQWGYFDTVIVSMQVVEEIWIIAEGKAAINVGFFKLLKMGRLLRMVRMVRLIPELKSMVYLILASMSSFFWSCVLLSLLVYVVAVYMTMMATDEFSKPGAEFEAGSNTQKLQEYWGSIGTSVMSVWWSISGGQDWADLLNPLIEESGNNVHNVIYSMFIAFATMVIMNLVTGVFVEGAQRLKQKDRDKELQRMAKKTFKVVDSENQDALSKEDFEGHLLNGDLDEYLAAVDLSQETACDLFDMLDEDKSGSVTFQEFVDGCIHLARLPRVADIAQVLLDVRREKEVLQELVRKMSVLTDSNRNTPQSKKSNVLRSTAMAVMAAGALHEV